MFLSNSILGGLADAIIAGIRGLFIPSDDFLNSWVSQMRALLSDHLGGLYQSVASIVDFAESLPSVTAASTISVPTFSIPLGGDTVWTTGGWTVQLKYNDLSMLYDGLAWITDFLCTAAFLNMLKKKLEVFLNPDSEKIEG